LGNQHETMKRVSFAVDERITGNSKSIYLNDFPVS
jgi:hypothetical protein